MRAESLRMSVRELLRLVLQELDVASACVEEIRTAVKAQDRPHATAAAMSLYWSWARAQRAIASLERVHGGGGASEAFARDALRASSRAGAMAIADALTLIAATERLGSSHEPAQLCQHAVDAAHLGRSDRTSGDRVRRGLAGARGLSS